MPSREKSDFHLDRENVIIITYTMYVFYTGGFKGLSTEPLGERGRERGSKKPLHRDVRLQVPRLTHPHPSIQQCLKKNLTICRVYIYYFVTVRMS